MRANKKSTILILLLSITIILISGCQVSTSDNIYSAGFPNIENIVEEARIIISNLITSISDYIIELSAKNEKLSELTPPLLEKGTEVTFQVQVPEGTPDADEIYLSLLDEVTGLALNAKYFPMGDYEAIEGDVIGDSNRVLSVTLPFEIGSIVKYRYERQAGDAQVAEHFTDGTPVRYRLLHVTGSGKVEDTVSRWSDSEYTGSVGRIMGEAVDAETSEPIANLLISVGGTQTISGSNGSFVIEGLTPGTHNLVAYSLDGSYKPFQQGAKIAADSTTPAGLELYPAEYIDVTFTVKVPPETPPAVPIRLAGNLYQLGNTFADFSGGINTIAGKMPTIEADEEGTYKLTLSLPIGTDVRYKYTLGDGFWNAERANPEGEFTVRQLIVPENNIQIDDDIETWYSEIESALIFDTSIPNSTPKNDYISIQFKPLFGWTEPIPMWKLGPNRWAYVLYNPLNLPGEFSYRYCRNGQCGKADDAATPGNSHPGRLLEITDEPISLDDQITAWVDFYPTIENSNEISETISTRAEGFWAGVELSRGFHPTWMERLPDAFSSITNMGSNWVIIPPTWSYDYNHTGNNPPIIKPSPGKDALWYDILDASSIGSELGLGVAHYPKPNFPIESDLWWQSAQRDYSWWLVWFNQYNEFLLHHADLAQKADADALIIGGEWLLPALPKAVLSDGAYSGVPADAAIRWREIISDVRERFEGELLWAHPGSNLSSLPTFIDAFDQIYLEINLEDQNEPLSPIELKEIEVELKNWLEVNVKPIHEDTGKPIVLSISVSSSSDLQTQSSIYESTLLAINEREWINGFISSGFYPAAALQDSSDSINGKPAFDLLSRWFPRMLADDYY